MFSILDYILKFVEIKSKSFPDQLNLNICVIFSSD